MRSQIQQLRISDDHRFLVKEDGSPFIWVGETNWFFAKLPPDQINRILDVRSEQGYTMMLVSCRERLYNGDRPGSPLQPNEAWWTYLDTYIEKCAERNLYVGITLGWWGMLRKFSAVELFTYGQWVGNRYKDKKNVVWFTLGEAGSHLRKDSLSHENLAALVGGVRAGDTGGKLLTVHADYQRGTSLSNDAKLCDFNNWQTSQWCCPKELPRHDDRTWTVWEAISHDYGQLYDGHPKPTLDAEAWYEHNKDFCGSTPFDIRSRAYFTIFAGACGHNYGAGGIWDGLLNPDSCSATALEALDHEGARQIGYLARFLHRLSDHFLRLIPDQSLIQSENSTAYDRHIQAMVSKNRNMALIYTASDEAFSMDLSRLAKGQLAYQWYNPRTHQIHPIKSLDQGNVTLFVDPPGDEGPTHDWVLVLGHEKIIEPMHW